MKVLKFGGSSVADATAISRVLDIIGREGEGDRVLTLCSAISGCTDALLEFASLREAGLDCSQCLQTIYSRHKDIIRRLFTGAERKSVEDAFELDFEEMKSAPSPETYGEIFSSKIIAAKLAQEDRDTDWLDSRKLIILRDDGVDKDLSYKNIQGAIGNSQFLVAPGFIAGDGEGNTVTLGRGGSDYSAALYAAALKADKLIIFTDVPGIMTTNPKDVPSAKPIAKLSYRSAFQLAAHGAKVLYAPTVEPAREISLPILIKDTFHPELPGSCICSEDESDAWIGIALDKTGGKTQLCIVSGSPIEDKDTEEILNRLTRSGVSPIGTFVEDGNCLIIKLPQSEAREALKICHHICFERESRINLYLAGEGKVGKALLGIIAKTQAEICIKGISRHENEDEALFEAALADNSGRRVFVDCTDSETIHTRYAELLEAGVNVVSSNRRALSVPYREYAKMKLAARAGKSFLRYETTVGASLPILESINLSANSADEIISIEAVVSCTLNYILTSGLPFGEALAKARAVGLTEADPTMDLSGRDALRKLLILGREAGIPLEEEDVNIEPVDGSQIEASQRFIALIEKDTDAPKGYRASIRLRSVSPEDPAYQVSGTDNMVSIRSAFHPSPLIIRGAGEGAKMAASSVLNDILR